MKTRGGQGWSLHTMLITILLAVTAVLLITLAVTLVPYISDTLASNAVERTQETVLQAASRVDLFTDRLLSTLNTAASMLPDNDTVDEEAWEDDFMLLTRASSDVTGLALFDADGACIYATAGQVSAAPWTVRDCEWFRLAMERSMSVTSFSKPCVQHLFGDQRAYVVSLSRQVEYYSGGGVHTGVLLMDVDYNAFSGLIEDANLGDSGYLYIVDEDGGLVAHPELQLIYAGQRREDTAGVNAQVLGQTRDEMDGRKRALIVASLAATRWRLVGAAWLDELLASQTAFMRFAAMAMLCAALLAIGAAAFMAFKVTRPITHLEHKMRMVEAGDLNVTITERGFREIRSVSAAFNHMLERIRELIRQNLREQEAKRLYELNALQAQINPHFLYNTLDSIVWMEERGKSREAITMVSALARLFRISISKGRSIITVGEEIEHVRNYVIIQKMRFKEKFECTIDVSDEAKSERTVKLILQPLVENALNHAIDEFEDTPLHIAVKAWCEAGELRFTVEDDGVGMAQSTVDGLLTRPAGKSGIGLRNVHERIRLTYGEPYGLTIRSAEGEGTLVTVRMPLGVLDGDNGKEGVA